MIEEIQNVIGLGAGAASKIFTAEFKHENLYNPLDLNCYVNGFQEKNRKRNDILKKIIY